jgi:hypothetical protein
MKNMNIFMKAIYIVMAITLAISIGVDAVSGKFDIWKCNCAIWVATAWMTDIRANKLEKQLNDIYDGSNK